MLRRPRPAAARPMAMNEPTNINVSQNKANMSILSPVLARYSPRRTMSAEAPTILPPNTMANARGNT